MHIQKIIKKMLAHSPIKYSERIDASIRLTLLKYWIEHHQPHPYFPTRESLYAYIAKTIAGNVPITLLEFGVYRGDSMLTWTHLNAVDGSEFIGFDSFEGLPEDWVNVRETVAAGSFSTHGIAPAIQDSRVRFIKGLFQETLPSFLNHFSTEKQLIIHCDADLYTSTLFVLCKLDPFIKPGTIIIFDDFSSMLHDFRALDDYTRSFHRHYEALGAAGRMYYEHVAIRITPPTA